MPGLADIADAGAWAVLAFCLISGIVGLFVAVTKKVLVPGWTYEEREELHAKSEVDWAIIRDQGDRNAKVLETVVHEQGEQLIEIKGLLSMLVANNHVHGTRRSS